MPDNWGYVAAAYGVAGLLLGLYWRHLVRRTADLDSERRRGTTPALSSPHAPRPGKPELESMPVKQSVRTPQPRAPRPGHPRPEPGAHGPQ